MEILFLILKIIGILFAVIILLLFSVVAVPVRYRIHAEVYGKAEGRAVFSWLFHIVAVRMSYEEDKMAFQLRICGIPINLEKEKGKESRKKKKIKRKKPRGKKKALGNHTDEADRPLGNDTDAGGTETSQPGADATEKQEEISPGTDEACREAEASEKIPEIRKGAASIKEKILNIREGAVSIKEKIQNIKNMILDETNRNAVRKLWQELRYVMRHFAPRKVSGELFLGMGDPARTGQVLGALSVLPYWARYKISIYPDFEADHIFVEGKLQMKGYIRLLHFLFSAIRLYKNGDIKQSLKRFRT